MNVPAHEQQENMGTEQRPSTGIIDQEDDVMVIYDDDLDLDIDIDTDQPKQQEGMIDREEGELLSTPPLLPTPSTPLYSNTNIQPYSSNTNVDVPTTSVSQHHQYQESHMSWRRAPMKPYRRYNYMNRKSPGYRYKTDDSAYYKIKPDSEYVPPNAEKWFAMAMEYAGRRYGQDTLFIMFCKCPYTLYDLDKFIALLETHKLSAHGTSDFSIIEMIEVCTHIKTIYSYYETEQIKKGVAATMYVNRIITVRDIQNTYIDKISTVHVLRWFVSEWNRICGRTITNVMAIIDNQYQKMNKQHYY